VDRTGETGEPCGVPTAKSNGSEARPLNLRRTVRFVRKDRHQLTGSGAKPRLATIATSLLWLTWSK
jgi:hypothetical protein